MDQFENQMNNNNRANEAQDIYSPFYLSPSDNSTTVVIKPPLDGKNFRNWERMFLLQLSVRNKIGFVDGTLLMPETEDPMYLPWIRCNNMVLTWMIYSVGNDIASNIRYVTTAKDAWDRLKARYAQPDKVRIYQIQNEISSLMQGHMTVGEYFTHLNGLFEELKVYRPSLGCVCGHCECRGLVDQVIVQQEDQVFRFLMGITTAYETVRGQILMMEPTPTMDKAYSIVLQEERQKQARNLLNTGVEASAMAMIGNKRKDKAGLYCSNCRKPGHATEHCMKCSYCKKPGHLVKTCYKIYGYPPGYRFTNTRESSANSGGYSSTTNQVESMVNEDAEHNKQAEVTFTQAEV